MDRRWPFPLACWLVGLAAGLWWFHTTADPRLAAPPLAPTDLLGWLAVTDPHVATMALVRALVLALGWYLLGVSLVGLLARLARLRRLVVVADLLSIPLVRRLLRSAVGTGLAATMVVAPTPARAAPLPLEILSQSSTAPGDAAVTSTPEDVTVTSTPSGQSPTAPSVRPLPLLLLDDQPSLAEEPAVAAAGQRQVAAGYEEHVVRAGESFWSIARDRLAADGRQPSDGRIVALWTRMIEDNRDRLSDPTNPDLLFPGQTLSVPMRS